MNPKSLIQTCEKPLILDGAIGSLLQQNGIPFDENLWTIKANIEKPDLVNEIHKKYLKRGADIISTNTFRTNPAAYKKSKLSISNKEFVKAAVELANSVKQKNIFVAGVNPPAEDSYKISRDLTKKDLIENHEKHIEFLWESGVDFILNETMSHLDEIIICAKYCSENKIPFITSLFFLDNLAILSGEKVISLIDEITKYDPILISINCVSQNTFDKLSKVIDLSKMEFGFYLNCGSGEYTDKEISCGVSPTDYAEFVKKYLHLNPKIVGSCCGSNPNHTKELRNLIDEVYRN